MFERELCKHPDINHVAYTPHSYNESHHWTMAACMMGGKKSSDKNCMGYGSKAAARQYMIDGLLGNIPDFELPENDGSLVFEGWDALCKKYAQPVFFEKSPQLIHRWDALELLLQWYEKTDFNFRFIGLIRNPMAVMNSAQMLFGTDPAERQFGWADSCRNLVRFEDRVSSENFLLVKYEDLIARPLETFSQVCDFIGVKPDGGIGKDVHSHSLNAWKKVKGFTLQLDENVAAIAKGYDYSDEDMVNPDKPIPTSMQVFWRRSMNKIRLTKSRLVSWYLKPVYLRFIKNRK